MFEIFASSKRDRLNMTVTGFKTSEEGDAIVTKMKEELAKVNPGAVIAVDFRNQIAINMDVSSYSKEIQQMIMQAKPSKIGTLVSSQVVAQALKQTAEIAGSEIITRRFLNENEWQEFLNQR